MYTYKHTVHHYNRKREVDRKRQAGKEGGIIIERSTCSYKLILHPITNNACIVGYMHTSENAIMFIIPQLLAKLLCLSVNMHEQSMFIKV